MSANEPQSVKEAMEIVDSTWATTRQRDNAHAYLLRNVSGNLDRTIAKAVAHLLMKD